MKQLIAAGLALTITFLLPANHLCTSNVYAAASNKAYVKAFRLFTKTNGSESDAKNWCSKLKENTDNDKSNDWYVVSGDLKRILLIRFF